MTFSSMSYVKLNEKQLYKFTNYYYKEHSDLQNENIGNKSKRHYNIVTEFK